MLPLHLMTFSILFGMELIRFLQICFGKSYQILEIILHNVSILVGFLFINCFDISDQIFSIGFRSGELPGQSRTVTFMFCRKFRVLTELCEGAKSCWNMNSLLGNTRHSHVDLMSLTMVCWYFSLLSIPSTFLKHLNHWKIMFPIHEFVAHALPLALSNKACTFRVQISWQNNFPCYWMF